MASPLKVATPLLAVTVAVPDKAAPGVPVPEVIVSVTWVVLSLVTVLLLASWMITTGWVVKAVPAVAPPGEALKANLAAGLLIVKEPLLVAVPPGVVTEIVPVVVPLATTAVIEVPEFSI